MSVAETNYAAQATKFNRHDDDSAVSLIRTSNGTDRVADALLDLRRVPFREMCKELAEISHTLFPDGLGPDWHAWDDVLTAYAEANKRT